MQLSPSIFKDLPFDPAKDFAPVIMVAYSPHLLVVNPGVPAKDVKELVALAKAQPGQLSYSSSGAGGAPHLAAEMFKDGTGTFILHVPYRGGGPAISDLIAGHVQLSFMTVLEASGHIKAGKLRALAVTSLQRNPLYPELPTIAESGFPGFQALSWSGLSAIKGTPQPIVDKLEATLRKIMTSAEIKQRLETVGFVVPPPGAAAYTKFVQSEIELWTRVIKTAGIKPE